MIGKKDKRIYIRVDSTEDDVIRRLAKKRGISVSKLLITLVKEEYLRSIDNE